MPMNESTHPSDVETDPARGFILKTVPVDGADRRYAIFVPPGYDPARPAPTIVFLNGKGECGTDAE